MSAPLSLAEKFAAHVTTPTVDGCLLWEGRRLASGYGVLTVAKHDSRLAHRVSWELANGPIPGGMEILHSCDTPQCVNPDHLSADSHQANVDDCVAKGRQARGESHGGARISEHDARRIRRLANSGQRTGQSLADEFGISIAQVSRIKNGQRWAHLNTEKVSA